MIKTIATALEKKSYDTLTPVQTAVNDPSIAEQDLLVSAQTGSGKTAAVMSPIFDKIHVNHNKTIKALVIAPMRELVDLINKAAAD